MKVLRISIWLVALSLSTLAQAASSKGQYSLCFTPGDDCTELIIQQIQAAKSSIYLQAYSFTATSIAKALVKAKHKGVKVRVLVDKSQRAPNSHSVVTWLSRQEIPIWIDQRPAIAHNKVIIIDNNLVITGSFNFTNSAQQRNAENVIVIRDPWVAEQYLANWQQRQQVSKGFTPGPQAEASWLEKLLNWLEEQLNKFIKKELRQMLNS